MKSVMESTSDSTEREENPAITEVFPPLNDCDPPPEVPTVVCVRVWRYMCTHEGCVSICSL